MAMERRTFQPMQPPLPSARQPCSALVNFGADGPEDTPVRLHVNAAGTNVQRLQTEMSSRRVAITSSTSTSIAPLIPTLGSRAPPELGTVLFAFADGEDQGGAFDPAHDHVVFTFTHNADNSFTFDLKGTDRPRTAAETPVPSRLICRRYSHRLILTTICSIFPPTQSRSTSRTMCRMRSSTPRPRSRTNRSSTMSLATTPRVPISR